MAIATHGQWQWQGGWRVTKRARERVARAMEMTMRVAGDNEGKGGKVILRVTRAAGKQMATAMATKRAMATKMRLGGAGGGNDQPLHTT